MPTIPTPLRALSAALPAKRANPAAASRKNFVADGLAASHSARFGPFVTLGLVARRLVLSRGERAEMAQPAPVLPPLIAAFAKDEIESRAPRFELIGTGGDVARARSTTFVVSLVVHTVLIALVVVIPILTYDVLPAPGEGARAFFAAPPEVAPPPPPPPPPPAGARAVAKAPAAPTPPPDESKFMAPAAVPDVVKPDEGIDVGVPGGVPGGVEGGVPGGVLGGVVGGIMPATPPPPPAAVRVGGQIKAPKSLHIVPPVYPELAQAARLAAVVIAEALVDTHGRVVDVKVLRGAPLFDDAAIAAVKQWRYQPLLLNGVPTEFILTVTVKFNLEPPR
jgi:protein TonB